MAVSLELLRLGLTYICLLLLWCGATHGGKPEIHALEQVLWSYSYYGQAVNKLLTSYLLWPCLQGRGACGMAPALALTLILTLTLTLTTKPHPDH